MFEPDGSDRSKIKDILAPAMQDVRLTINVNS